MLTNNSKSRLNRSFTNLNQAEYNVDSTVHKTTSPSLNDESYIVEEQSEDCVYQITYKKVYTKTSVNYYSIDTNNNRTSSNTYRLSNEYQNLNNNSNQNGLVYTRIKIKQLKLATLPKFIEHLTNEETGELDSNLVHVFLATYRTFTNTNTVLKLIRARYEKILPASLEMTEDVRLEHLKSFRLILKLWLENYQEDFNEPNEYSNLNELNRFAHKFMPDSDLVQLIRSKFDQFESLTSSSSLNDSSSSINLETNNQIKLNMSDSANLKTHRRSCSNLDASNSNNHNLLNRTQSRSQTNLNNLKNANNSNKDSSTITSNFFNLLSNFNYQNKRLSDENYSINLDDKFMCINSHYIAEQLTYLDKCLFQKVIAHQCLGSVWGTRYQKNSKSNHNSMISSSNSNTLAPSLSDKFAAIASFIEQFNRVSYIVQSTILDKEDLKPYERAKIVKKWIEIAQYLRKYKNFSSLNAIVQGLNTQCVSRLEKTWNEVPSELKQQFDELTEMFSQDQNQKIFRDILMKDLDEIRNLFDESSNNIFNLKISEGTAKYADINSGINATLSRKMKEKMIRQQAKKQFREPIGTIPFLGTFLKDLEYINAQNPKNEKGLINIQQKRKEFEIIAQIKLLQQASFLYNIKPDANFKEWLYSQQIYQEAQYYDFSYKIEPKHDPDSNRKSNKLNLSQGSRSESIESLNLFNNSNKTPSLKSKSNTNKNHSRNSSMASSDLVDNLDSPQSNFKNSLSSSQADNQSTSSDGLQTLPKTNKSTPTPNSPNNEIKVKVNIENLDESKGILYKKISITDKYRTKDVKKLILQKFFMNPEAYDKYSLVQLINQNSNENNSNNNTQTELIIKDYCNVFYAHKNVPDMRFVLRPRADIDPNSNQPVDSYLIYNNQINQAHQRSSSLNRNGLPPQSPNYQQKNKNQQHNPTWKLFKKLIPK